ncbi:unnamed protein product [Malus baccata var. baccata]
MFVRHNNQCITQSLISKYMQTSLTVGLLKLVSYNVYPIKTIDSLILGNFPLGHPLWDCSRVNSLNFGVPMEPEASELPKGLVLGRDENIHIRLTGSTPLDDV